MNARMFFLGVLFLLACDNATDNPADSSGVSVVMGKCGNGIAKQASKTGVLHFASRDSLSLAFRASLNCAAEYAFASRMIDASTLSLTAEDVGDIRARCMC